MSAQELIYIANWPLWLQIPGAILGLWALWKISTFGYWGPTA